MPTDDSGFWDEPQGAATFKHDVVSNQLGAFTGKAGSRSEGQRVGFADGFAGPGAYASGDPGSPQIAANVATQLRGIRNLDGFFIELQPRWVQALRARLDEHGFSHWKVLQGTCQERLPEVLKAVGEAPLLVLLDPYGLGIPFEQLLAQVLGRPQGSGWSRRRITEVILHFTLNGLSRMGGFLDKDYTNVVDQQPLAFLEDDFLDDDDASSPQRIERRLRQQQQALRSMDDFLGGDWWREVKRSHVGPGDWREEVLRRWIQLVRERTNDTWDLFPVAVADAWGDPPAYYLVLLTQNVEGILVFIEGVSKANDRLYRDSWEPTPSGTLFTMDEPPQEPPDLGPEYVEQIADNVRRFVANGRQGRPVDHLRELYGETLGKARHTHLFQAIKKVQKEGGLEGPAPRSEGLEKNYVLKAKSA